MVRILLVCAGSLSLGLGVLGIFVPGLPTTVFLLGAAACFVKSSDRLYNWMLNHKVLGLYIRNYRKYKAMPLRSKIIALTMMWTMIGISSIFFIHNLTVKIIVIVAGLIGSMVILRVKTLRKDMIDKR